MTQDEWRVCTDPEAMVRFLLGKASDRKMRLFGVACCRRVWHLLPDDPRPRNAVLIAKRFADGLASAEELAAALDDNTPLRTPVLSSPESISHAFSATDCVVEADLFFGSQEAASHAAEAVACAAGEAVDGDGYDGAWKVARSREEEVQCRLLRDIIGPSPCQPPPAPNPSWLAWNDGVIPKLAQAIYDECAFDRLPILADALEDAGCDNPAILAHCRSGGEHVRGCWVVDLLLGQS